MKPYFEKMTATTEGQLLFCALVKQKQMLRLSKLADMNEFRLIKRRARLEPPIRRN